MEHLMTVPKRFQLIYRWLIITVNWRMSARPEGIFKNFNDRSDISNLGQLPTSL